MTSKRAKIVFAIVAIQALFIIFLFRKRIFGIKQTSKLCRSMNVTCPTGGNNGVGTRPKSCPKSIPQLDLKSYISSLEDFTPGPNIDNPKPSDKILSLVAIAENSNTDWEKNLNYIEDIGDGRGFTISIVGFCTGTGDFLKVVQRIAQLDSQHQLIEFIPALEAVNETPCHDGLDRLQNTVSALGSKDEIFNKAVFDLIQKLYWGPALEYCKSKNLTSPLANYIAYDTILNFGDLSLFQELSGGDSEEEFLENFLDIKECVIEKCGSLGEPGKELTGVNNRVDMARSILEAQNLNLTKRMTVDCYGDKFNI